MESDEYPFDIVSLHTTPMGEERIRKNLQLNYNIDATAFCRNFILEDFATFERKGKNWYVTTGHVKITINARSNTIMSAPKI